MKKINLGITGCMGRMGQQLIKSSKANHNFKLKTLTENKLINKRFNGIKPELNTEIAFKKTDVIIDFTIPNCTLEMLKIAVKLKKRVVIGTTGFTKREEKLIKKYSKKIPILKAGNMSLGVNLLMYLTEIASKSLNNSYLTKVFEVHHKHKKDYPSGTALMLGRGIADGKSKDFNKLTTEYTEKYLKDSETFKNHLEDLEKSLMDGKNGHEPMPQWQKLALMAADMVIHITDQDKIMSLALSGNNASELTLGVSYLEGIHVGQDVCQKNTKSLFFVVERLQIKFNAIGNSC